jgi:diaminopimelate epimerase
MPVSQINNNSLAAGVPSTAKLPAGTVLQVVQSLNSTFVSSSSSTFVDTGLTATITPTSASSKILALMSVNGLGKANNDVYVVLRLVRNSTDLTVFNRGAAWTSGSVASGVGASAGIYLDSPATTSATTYKVQFASGGNASVVYYNVSLGGGTGESSITLMEIAA